MSSDTQRALADQLHRPVGQGSLARLPRLTGRAISLVWKAAPRELGITLVLQVVSSVILGLQVITARYLLVDLLRNPTSTEFHRSVPWLLIVGALLAAGAIIAVLQTEMQRLLSELVSRFSMGRVVDAATGADLIAFEHPDFHDRLQRATVNASIRPIQMTTGLISVGSASLACIAVSASLVVIEPYLLLLGLLAIVPLLAVSLRLGRALYHFSVTQTPIDRQRIYVQQLLTEKHSAKEIRAYDLAPYLKDRFSNLYDVRLRALRRLIRTRTVQGVMGGALTGTVTAGTLALILLFVSDGRISLAGAGAAVAALLLLASQLRTLSSGFGRLYESALYIQDFTDFVNVPSGQTGSGIDSAGEELAPGTVSMSNVSFTYPSRTEASLSDINLTIGGGEVIALVGENGSGKTTLAKLLAGLYEPHSGSISWQPGLEGSHRVAVLFQDFVRYFMSARDNIAMGSWEHATDESAVLRAARRAGTDAFVSSLPAGLDTILGPQFLGGSDLSGGQWQRIALARAFFRDAAMVILDEPTASLDPQAEAELFGSVRELFAGRSVVLITHRFGSAKMADCIYVMDKGRIVEAGRHEELMDRGGIYYRLFSIQAAAYESDGSRSALPLTDTQAEAAGLTGNV